MTKVILSIIGEQSQCNTGFLEGAKCRTVYRAKVGKGPGTANDSKQHAKKYRSSSVGLIINIRPI